LILPEGESLPATITAANDTTSAATTAGAVVSVTVSSSPTASSASTSSTAGIPPAAGPSPDRGLSVGAKAGIGAGVGVTVVVIIVLVFWVLRLYRRVQAASNKHAWGIIPEDSNDSRVDQQNPNNGASARSIPAIKQISGLHEVPGKQPSVLHEVLGDRRHPTELNATGSADKEKPNVVHEMPG
jgi:hypothetical protein